LLQHRVGPRAWLYGAIGGMAPDLDIFIRSGSDPLVALTYHRHFTHSLAFIPVGGFLSALPWIARAKHRDKAKQIVQATTVGYATHALLDAFTTYGTQLWWPLSSMRVAWNFISIIDLLFTVPLAIGVVLAARRQTRRPVARALAWCALYMGVGGIQHGRAVATARSLATVRGHELSQIEAFPNAFCNLAWRTAYRARGKIFVDWVYTPWWGKAEPHAGGAVRIATEDTLPAPLREDPATLQAFRTFTWFADGWVAADPEAPGSFGDMRYGAGIGNTLSMWTITLRPGTQAPVAFERHTDRIRLADLWQTVRGRG
ncbi:MAG: metal-dependent hydrolase, partial [Myxococcota bacterium]